MMTEVANYHVVNPQVNNVAISETTNETHTVYQERGPNGLC